MPTQKNEFNFLIALLNIDCTLYINYFIQSNDQLRGTIIIHKYKNIHIYIYVLDPLRGTTDYLFVVLQNENEQDSTILLPKAGSCYLVSRWKTFTKLRLVHQSDNLYLLNVVHCPGHPGQCIR